MVDLNGIQIIKNDTFYDHRGSLYTIYNSKDISNNLIFNHDKISRSKKNVLRGLHADKSWKLITCIYGSIQLVVVNYDKNHEQYLKWQSFIINSEDKIKISILVPPGFLNGHLVLSDEAIFHYKWSYDGKYPDIDEQISVKWNDPKINIIWKIENPILSKRDENILV
jgi:dTDP-4-dehydrorhamnose 3,5-epimerase